MKVVATISTTANFELWLEKALGISRRSRRRGIKGDMKRQTSRIIWMLMVAASLASAVPAAVSFATMPEAAASFGAVVSGGWLYIYGGHVSQTHL